MRVYGSSRGIVRSIPFPAQLSTNMSVIPYAVVCFRTVTDTMRVISATQGSKEFEATHQQRWSRNITGVTARYNA
jgi:hypothetical protein